MVTNFHAVDPSGDLFRFAHSKFTAFGRMKTYNRAGVYLKFLVPYFNDAHDFAAHWTTALIMKLEKQYQEVRATRRGSRPITIKKIIRAKLG